MFFPGFTLEHVAVGAGKIRLRRGGSGPPLLLLHGNPQTHAMWHAVAPSWRSGSRWSARTCAATAARSSPKRRRTMRPTPRRRWRSDMVEVMEHLGHRRFLVGSHDRGARVAHAWRSTSPIGWRSSPCSTSCRPSSTSSAPIWPSRSATTIGSGSPSRIPSPRSLINAAPEAWFTAHTSREPKPSTFFHPEAMADYLACGAQPRDDPRHVRGLPRRRQHRSGARPRQPRRRRQGAMPAAGAVGRQGQDRPVVRRPGDLAAILRRPR